MHSLTLGYKMPEPYEEPMNRQQNPPAQKHGARECGRRKRQGLIGSRMAPPRVAPVREYTPPEPPPVNRARHYIIAPGSHSNGTVVRRYPKLRGKANVKAAKRARIAARERAAARMARRAQA